MSDSTVPPRRRVYIACLNCRKRKIKCMTDDTEQQPCERCIRKGLMCEYLAVGNEDSTSAPPPGRSSAGHSPSSSSYPSGSYPVSTAVSNGAYGTHRPPHAIHPQSAPSQPQPQGPHFDNSAHQYQGHRAPAPYPVPSQYNHGPSSTYGRVQPPMQSPFPPPNQAGPSAYPTNYGYYSYTSSHFQAQLQPHSLHLTLMEGYAQKDDPLILSLPTEILLEIITYYHLTSPGSLYEEHLSRQTQAGDALLFGRSDTIRALSHLNLLVSLELSSVNIWNLSALFLRFLRATSKLEALYIVGRSDRHAGEFASAFASHSFPSVRILGIPSVISRLLSSFPNIGSLVCMVNFFSDYGSIAMLKAASKHSTLLENLLNFWPSLAIVKCLVKLLPLVGTIQFRHIFTEFVCPPLLFCARTGEITPPEDVMDTLSELQNLRSLEFPHPDQRRFE
ncbi:hypothetical protein C8R43DRAFT_1141400 [Mycena crocata]|nr:hypothetical protein C8R43DRAFT_1141400 [Mycena crocata]